MERQIKSPWSEWEVNRLIGRGSFGTVYEIQRDVFGDIDKAALKVISIPQNASDIDEMYSDGYDDESITSTFQSHLKSIVAEYSLMRKMNGCANIVNCDDVRYVQHDDGIGWDIFIKMELLTPLTKSLPPDISEETVIKIAQDMCTALEICKEYSVVHRDIKPQNIFVSNHGNYKLGDFGIAKTVEKTMGGTKIGTYKYMAPEVYNNQPYGAGADIYSLGLVLYWLLNERRMPFLPLPPAKLSVGMEETARQRRFSGETLPVPKNGSKVLKAIVLKACAFDPEARYQSAGELLADLSALGTGSTATSVAGLALVVDVDKASTEDQTVDLVGEKNSTPEEVDDGFDGTVGPALDEQGSKTVLTPPPKTVSAGKKKNPWPLLAAALLVLVLLVVALFEKHYIGEEENLYAPSNTTWVTNPLEETVVPQPRWSEWMDSLPAFVTSDTHEIEEKILYRSCIKETTSSTTVSTMDGWILYDAVESDKGYGTWGQWSEEKVSASNTRKVETEQRYRFRDKETTTSSSSSMNEWKLYDTTYHWGDYGSWSDWSTTEWPASISRQVETKPQYRHRDVTITQELTDWGAWSGWSDTKENTNDYKKEETRTVWGYYYFLCSNCGAHMHGYGTCYTWAGGCGARTDSGDWHAIWSTVSWDDVRFKDWHGTGKYFTYLDGELVFKWSDNGQPKTQYRYATRSLTEVTNYGSWSGWSDTAVSVTASREVQTRTMYRYRDRSQIATYHFWKWGGWSSWSSASVSSNSDREVETCLFYRYCDRVTETTYFFWRWSEWSEYSEQKIEASDTIQVETKSIYRYRPKPE